MAKKKKECNVPINDFGQYENWCPEHYKEPRPNGRYTYCEPLWGFNMSMQTGPLDEFPIMGFPEEGPSN